MHVYTHTYVCIYVYIYIYTYTHVFVYICIVSAVATVHMLQLCETGHAHVIYRFIKFTLSWKSRRV